MHLRTVVRAESVTIDESTEQMDRSDGSEIVVLEQRMVLPESLEELTLDERRRPGPLGPMLAQHVIELVLERANARRPDRKSTRLNSSH